MFKGLGTYRLGLKGPGIGLGLAKASAPIALASKVQALALVWP